MYQMVNGSSAPSSLVGSDLDSLALQGLVISGTQQQEQTQANGDNKHTSKPRVCTLCIVLIFSDFVILNWIVMHSSQKILQPICRDIFHLKI